MTERLKSNWFWPLTILMVAAAWFLARIPGTSVPTSWEFAVVFDVLITLPLLFAFCYAKKLSRKQLIIRILALQGLGIFIAGYIVPNENQSLLPQLGWLRNLGFGILIVVELAVLISVLKVVFRKDATVEQLEDRGMPPMVAKLALMEARFWRWVFSLFKR